MKKIVYCGLLIVLAMVASGATLTCQQTGDSSVSIPQFSSKEISVRCTASGGSVSNIQITPNSYPSTGLTITNSNPISSSISDQSSSTAKWTVTGDSPNTYALTYTISSSGINTWSGASTTTVDVPSSAKLTVEYVLPPSFFTVTVDELDVKINNIGGTTASNVRLKLNDGQFYDYPVTIAAGSSASYSWTNETGFNSSGAYTTKVYIGDSLQDSVSAVVSSTGSGNISLQEDWNLISLSEVPTNLSPESVFANNVDDVDIVWGKVGQNFYKYDPDGQTTLTSMDPKNGYYVRMLTQNELSVEGVPHSDNLLELFTGWNLVGYPATQDNMNVNDTVESIVDNIDIIWALKDGVWVRYNPATYDPGNSGHLHNFTLGRGYWYKVTDNVNLTFS